MSQGDYAAQVLGLNAEHMASNEMMHHMHQPAHSNYQNEAKRSNSRDASPSLRQTPTSSTPPTSSYSPFAQHKLKLGVYHDFILSNKTTNITYHEYYLLISYLLISNNFNYGYFMTLNRIALLE